jgi:predicted dithiol-disulfide oxidoreductase (DUF899 family)
VKVEKQYVFDDPDGKETLADLFGGRSQLVIYHFMFGPDWKEEMAQGKINYNYTTQEFPSEEAPGISVFYKDVGGDVFHTYSTYGRGVEPLVGTYMILDMVPKGRDEDHLRFTMEWVRHHDRYGTDEFVDANKPYWPATALPSSTTG